MSITGLCQICESREATHSCQNCGTLVCELHYDEGRHLCSECAARIDAGERSQPGRGSEDLPGDDAEDDVYR